MNITPAPKLPPEFLQQLLTISPFFQVPAIQPQEQMPQSGVMGDLKRRLLFMDMLGKM